MIAQKYKKNYDVEFSIINLSELEGDIRIDSEYYEPAYIKNEELITSHEYSSIGNLLSKCEYGISIAMNEDGNGFKMLKMDDIIGILANDINCKYAEISENTFKKYKLINGDVLFNRVNSEEFVGRTGIYLLDGEHTFASYLVRIRAKKDFSNYYIATYLNSKYGKMALKRVSRRAVNQANINAEELKSLSIPIPSDNFQKKIRDMIKYAQEEINTSRNILLDSERLILSEIGLNERILNTKTINTNKGTISIEENISIRNLSDVQLVDRLDAEYWDLAYDDIEKIIENYENGYDSLPNLITVSKEKRKIDFNNTYNYIELANIDSDLGTVNQTQEIIGSELPSRAKMKVQKNDILQSSVEGSIDKIALIDFDKKNLLASTGFFIFKENKLNKETILVMLKAFSKIYIKRQAQGTILTAIPSSSLIRIKLPKIKENVQNIISKQIEESFNARNTSQLLLEIAVNAVNIFIEENEEAAEKWVESEINNIGVKIDGI